MQSDEEEIRQMVSTWMAASKAGDVEAVLSLMADDVVFLVPGQPVMRKADFAVAARAQSGQGAPQFDGRSEIREIRVLGEWAFMWTKAHRRRYANRRCAIHDACRPYAVHPREAERKMGAGARCQHAGACAGQVTPDAMKTRATANGQDDRRNYQAGIYGMGVLRQAGISIRLA